jgi:hypothetical protein
VVRVLVQQEAQIGSRPVCRSNCQEHVVSMPGGTFPSIREIELS